MRSVLQATVLGLLLASEGLAAQPASRPSIADFAEPPVATGARLSADGKLLAARSWQGDTSRILIFDATNPSKPPRALPLGKSDVTSISWAGANRLLLRVRKYEKLFDQVYPFTRLIVVDIDTGQSRVADPANQGVLGGDVLYTDPDGQTALVASQDTIFDTPAVKRVDLATGKATLVEKPRPDVWDWYADSDGVVRAGFAYDNRAWKLFYRDKAGEPLRTIKGKFDKNSDSSVDRFTFGRAGTGTIITNERTGRFGVYRYDFTSGSIGEAIFEDPEVDVTGVWGDRWSGDISGIEYENDRKRFVWLDPDLKQTQARIDRALPTTVNEIVSRSRDKAKLLIFSSSASDPGAYFLLDQTTRKMNPVYAPLARIDPAQLSATTHLRYAARDGLGIPAYLTLPKGKPGKLLPTIVMPHGGPFIRDSWEYDTFVQFIASRGYAVFQPQFRGSTGYGKSFVEKGYGQWGRAMQDDLDDGLDHLIKTGVADPKRVCIVGASYGGYAALWGAIRNPERYRCAASLAGVTDLDAQLKANRKSFTATRYFREWRTKVAGEQKVDLATVSPLQQAARLKVPVLIGHGEKDEVVPVRQGRAIVQALQGGRAEVTSVFYAKSGHDLEGEGDLADYLGRLEAFLHKHNPAG
ncbi:dipeptidyl aminopeptidase/acylaminoacyl peptidase [Sphingomonas kaistensis]|uniref:Dipeptidyl aminopeptidase/acylaminoacyl peptidase n=1 Tax=Sphingomonas kaistensis TaxID=298708 RepID=A0A7X5Y5I6_9SPHN|nr:alpha/beta fold hydrolase [Sphingomonas kaistensis]NJC05148.1 dipeptidyl aminopeptidase/acylaminoacyl peptidase [Sphingomonas kaistensis]